MIKRAIEWLFADHFLHFGWAWFGQECDCGHNRFNWLARRIGEGNWDDEGNPADRWTRVKFEVGRFFIKVHGSLLMLTNDKPHR